MTNEASRTSGKEGREGHGRGNHPSQAVVGNAGLKTTRRSAKKVRRASAHSTPTGVEYPSVDYEDEAEPAAEGI
jgi:hypothetical protein